MRELNIDEKVKYAAYCMRHTYRGEINSVRSRGNNVHITFNKLVNTNELKILINIISFMRHTVPAQIIKRKYDNFLFLPFFRQKKKISLRKTALFFIVAFSG